MIYNQGNTTPVPNLDLLTFILDSEFTWADADTPLSAEAQYPEKHLTTADVCALTRQFAYFLRHRYAIGSAGHGKDVVVAVSTGQSVLPAAFYGVVAAGAIYSSASYAATESELTRQVEDGPAKLIICSKDRRDLAERAARGAGLPDRNVLILESHPKIRLYSADDSVECDFRGSLDWKRITDAEELRKSKICLVYSSGTTGLPKGVLLSHLNLVAAAHIPSVKSRQAWGRRNVKLSGRTLAHLPSAHIAGLMAYFVRPVLEGRLVYWMPTFQLDAFLKYCGELNITQMFTVPPIIAAITRHPAAKERFKHLMHALTGAAPISRDLQEVARQKLPVRVDVSWGMSETTGGVTFTPIERKDVIGSIGVLMNNMLLRLIDEDGRDVEPGQPGEGLIKGPTVVQGYHNNPEGNKGAFTEDGWLRTGDIFRMENGLLFIELIKYKGSQVAPAELEGVLTAHPSVIDAAVIGVEREDTEVPRGYVVLAPDAVGKVSEADIVAYVAGKVSNAKRLRGGVRFIDAVPRSAVGKILRKDLRALQKREAKL
ncbi:putative acyl-coenzyme A synthetase [Escovopsis weberi]|uniref:Putative acyl-coenzyme A synthetase n=1 Tax=Escovopsis weberi TaxID=150374 RepID=A0A0M8N3K5_ESCWE|nr:putative acyl-coenzyme A synthetase [Escovopsis weberi]